MIDNPYEQMSSKQLCDIIKDIQQSKKDGKRVESFVPHAKLIFKNLNHDTDSYTIPLAECIRMAQDDFYTALCHRFLGVNDELLEMVDTVKAFRSLDVPRLVDSAHWEPDRCPSCKYALSEHKDNRVYVRSSFFERCPRCSQRLKWSK